MAPRSQKADVRAISFRLEDGAGGDSTVGLVIRPEDLGFNENALQAPVQTLGGAFLDDFGAGLSTLQLSGHTGWGSGVRPDGFQTFQDLHATIWNGWHAARKAAVEAGRSPTDVRLTFVDDLDEICVSIAPGAFQLKRNRSRPLLSMYNITATVLGRGITPPLVDPLNMGAGGSINAVKAGLTSLQSTINTLNSAAANIHNFIDATLAAPLGALVGQASSAMSQVMGLVGAARGVVTSATTPFIGIAADFSLLGRNVFNTYNAIANLPDFLANQVSEVASAFNNAYCVLKNAFRKVQEYPDYTGIYGASNCSSTVGGSPVSSLLGSNPWEVILPDDPLVAAVTPTGRANIDLLKATDPVLAPMDSSELGSRVQSVLTGVTFAWL